MTNAISIARDAAFFLAGGAFIWFAKDTITKMVIGANALSAKLHSKANAISAAAKQL